MSGQRPYRTRAAELNEGLARAPPVVVVEPFGGRGDSTTHLGELVLSFGRDGLVLEEQARVL